jgi:hypothetical protein
MGSQFNIRDMPERSAQQVQELADWTGYTKTQIVLIAVENLWKEVKQERQERMIKGNIIEKDGDFTMTIDGIVARVYDGKKEIFSSGDHGEAEERFVEEATTRDLIQQQEKNQS